MPKYFLIIICLVVVLLTGFLGGYFLCLHSWENRKNVLPNPYRDWYITKEMYLDINNDNKSERLVAITDKLWDMTSNAKVLILQNKQFIEVPAGYGASIIWWQGGDFNKNGKMELAVQYDSYGSGNLLDWYLCEWDGSNFHVILEGVRRSSKLDIKDIDSDGRAEIIHSFIPLPDESSDTETFKWDTASEKYIMLNFN
jgi:hypothetical protein